MHQSPNKIVLFVIGVLVVGVIALLAVRYEEEEDVNLIPPGDNKAEAERSGVATKQQTLMSWTEIAKTQEQSIGWEAVASTQAFTEIQSNNGFAEAVTS
jgi:hypothetical protein